jgi:Ca-activated chloride channel family protein
MKLRLWILSFCLLAIHHLNAQEKLTRILFILDASNSMNVEWSGKQTRIEAAKELLAASIDSLRGSANLEVALRVYGHQSPVTAVYQDCNDTKLEVPFGVNNYDAIRSRIKTIQAKGTTPIARSLEAAAGDFPDTLSKNVIILITDGLEACDNDPCVIAKKLKDKGVKVTPFVIGIGLDISYLDKFNCIGQYEDAQSKESFKNVLTGIIKKVLYNTTAQINLNNINKEPKETNVSMFLYEAGTSKLKYTFVHTINKWGNPDTLILDPNIKYDLFVNTLPPIEKKDISIIKNKHNTIIVDAPQGFIKVRMTSGAYSNTVLTRIMQQGSTNTLNVQTLGMDDKYLVGKYDLEILTLPRIYRTIEVTQSTTTHVDIPASGYLEYMFYEATIAQIFVLREGNKPEWVCNLDDIAKNGVVELQPGNYRLVSRVKSEKISINTRVKDFRIISNKTVKINQ